MVYAQNPLIGQNLSFLVVSVNNRRMMALILGENRRSSGFAHITGNHIVYMMSTYAHYFG